MALAVVFFLPAWVNAAGSAGVLRPACCEGILRGLPALCTGLAQVLNEVYGRTVLPLGTVKKQGLQIVSLMAK